jgi:hypothetical protein
MARTLLTIDARNAMTTSSFRPERPTVLEGRALLLGTFSFALCFAAWGRVAAAAPLFRQGFGLSASQMALQPDSERRRS